MIIFFSILHTIGLLLLIREVLWTAKTYSILPTIHNLPILGMWALILLGTIYLSLFHPWIYLGVGIPFGIFQFILESIDLPGRPNFSLLGKVLSALSVVFLWPELGSYTIFCVWNADKIIDEEPKP